MDEPETYQMRQEPYGWQTYEWKPADIDTALTNADGGDLQLASDLCDAMEADDRVRGVLATRVNALLGLNGDGTLTFDCADNVRDAIEVDWYRSAPEDELGRLMRRALLLGVGIAQREVLSMDSRWVPVLRPWDTRYTSWSWMKRRFESYDATGVSFDIDPTDPQWVLMTPYGASRPWAQGAWRALAILWLAKQHSIRDWARHNSLHGSGMITGKLPEGVASNTAGAKKFWSDLKAISRNARIVLPAGYTVEVLEAQARTWESFPKLIETANTGIAVVLLGQPLTTEVPNAIRTGANAASGVRQDYLEFDAQWLSTWAHEVHLPAWTRWNFGEQERTPWLEYHTDPPTDLAVMASTIGALGDSIAKLQAVAPSGFRIDTKALFEKWGIPLVQGNGGTNVDGA